MIAQSKDGCAGCAQSVECLGPAFLDSFHFHLWKVMYHHMHKELSEHWILFRDGRSNDVLFELSKVWNIIYPVRNTSDNLRLLFDVFYPRNCIVTFTLCGADSPWGTAKTFITCLGELAQSSHPNYVRQN